MFNRADTVPFLGDLEPRLLMSAAPGWPADLPEAPAGHLPAAAVAALAGMVPFESMLVSSGWKYRATDDVGNTTGAARRVSLTTSGAASLTAKIEYLGDVDVFAVTPAKSGTLKVTLAPSGNTWNYISGDLAAYAGSTLLARDANAATMDASVSFSVTGGTTYYIRAASLNSRTGSYGLKFAATWTVVPTPPPPAPSPDPDPVPPTPAPGTYSPGTSVTWRVESVTGGSKLVVLGTDSADTITVSKSGASTVVYVSGVLAWTSSQVFSAVAVYGFGGDDLLVSVSGVAETLAGGAGLDSFWCDSRDQIADTEAAETAAKSLHSVGAFYQPAGSTVSLELAGQKIADPAAGSYTYTSFSSYRLFTDGPEYNDINQGAVGDCYFLAVLSSLAQTDPAIIRQMVAPLGDGTYAVRFFSGSTATYIRVDADLPVYNGSSVLAYADRTPDGEIWVALVEKAYAQYRTGANSYASLSGGWMSTVYPQVTGVSASDVYTSNASESTLANQINSALVNGHAVTCGSTSAGSTAIVGGHAYEVRSIQLVNGQWTVTVYNPWGVDGKQVDSNYNDGLVTLTMAQFKAVFTAVSICNA